jgi:hypothetical protein
MSASTTIKVSRELRDRIAARAAREGTTLAGAIAHALDVSEEEVFWAEVAEHHRRGSRTDRTDGTLREHLEPADDELGRDGW